MDIVRRQEEAAEITTVVEIRMAVAASRTAVITVEGVRKAAIGH